jgi:hypothetical protein
MAPCNPNDVSLKIPSGPSGPSIPGFGTPFAINAPNLNPFPDGFPEDLLTILDKLQLLVPPGALKPQLNPNFGKDTFDGIMKLLDQFMPFLMLYKFFLPILNMIICIIEVLCAIPNPFKLPRAIRRLFTRCLPQFLNIFPIFALIIMIISLLLLMLALVEYIVAQILKFVQSILRNIAMLNDAFQEGSATSVLAIAKKLGSLLCIFQNLFVLLSLFSIIIQVIRDMLSLTFAIPPCDDGNHSDSGCCTPDVCPVIVKNPYTRTTGTFKYLNTVQSTTINLFAPEGYGNSNINIRPESWQMYDSQQNIAQAFRNIVDGYDQQPDPLSYPPPFHKQVFFPTDASFNSGTAPNQAPYVVDLRLFYNPVAWGRTGLPRYIRFLNCIVPKPPVFTVAQYDNSTKPVDTGVFSLVGGLGYEDDGVTPLKGFGSDGYTQISNQATIENFVHKQAKSIISESNVAPPPLNQILLPTDGYTFSDIEYTFTPHTAPLLKYNLVTLGCLDDVALPKNFINTVYAGDVSLKTQLLGDLINSRNGNTFPDPAGTQQCLATALSALRGNLTNQGVADFQATATLCLNKLRDDTNGALGSMIGIGFDPCKSLYTLTPSKQFTSKPILVSVDLKERNGLDIATGLSVPVAENIAARIKAHITFGDIGKFSYDGYHSFVANLTSPTPGTGSLMISFDNNTFCTNSDDDLTHTLQEKKYQFVYAPQGLTIPISPSSEGDQSDGTQPRRDDGDQSRDSGSGG